MYGLCRVMGCFNGATHTAEYPDGRRISVCEKCADELNATKGCTVWNQRILESRGCTPIHLPKENPTPEYYAKHVKCKSCEENTGIDVYDVLQAFDVTCPAIQHAVKKLLRCGNKPGEAELDEIRGAITSLNRAVEMRNG